MPPTAHKHKYNDISLVIHTEKRQEHDNKLSKNNLQSWQNNQRTSGTQLDRTDWWSSRLQGL